MAQEENRDPSKRQALEKILDGGLKLLSAEDLKPHTPCPDSWTFALYVQGQLDEDAQRSINAHIAFCSECYHEYLALAEPEDVMKEVERELHSATATPAERSPDAWRLIMEHLKSFVLDLGKKYGTGAMLGPVRILAETSAVRGKRSSLKLSKLLEMSVGDNTYSIELGLRHNGSLHCDFDGERTPHKIPLRIVLRQETGEALLPPEETNIHGNGDFEFPADKILGGVLVLDLHLDGQESHIAFVLPH